MLEGPQDGRKVRRFESSTAQHRWKFYLCVRVNLFHPGIFMEILIHMAVCWSLGIITGFGLGTAIGSERMRKEMLRDWMD